MNKFFCIFCILLFISKTENVFSNSLIYDVNNVVVEGKTNNNLINENLAELAFRKAFVLFVNKTLLKKDALNLYKTKPETIKDLVLTYQIVKNEKNKTKGTFLTFNIRFDSKKINNFLAEKKILYADVSNISLTLLPILIKNKQIFLYEENFFYKNWIKLKNLKVSNESELISYTLALENIEDLEYINNIQEKINLLDIKKINSFKGSANYALVIIYSAEGKLKAFIKTSIKNINIDRNIDLNFYKKNENESYNEAIIILKKEINQIWKEQNLVDVNIPSFLDFFLEIQEIDDYLSLKSALDTINIIEDYSVLEMTNRHLKMRIKYKGKLNKIKTALTEKNININIDNNVWRLNLNK